MASFNEQGQLYGTSKYLGPAEGARLVAEAELEEFAPCYCVCFSCCVPDKARKRTYIRAYEDRLETNWPIFPCLCCTNERCMTDNTRVFFFDKQPSRVGMFCHCIPCLCCGPPVVFNHIPRCCCALIDCRPCFGEDVRHAPCNCGGLRCCLFCGTPCYYYWSSPLFWPLKHGEVFLSKWKGALDAYQRRNGLDKSERTRFTRVAMRPCDCDAVQKVVATPWPPKAATMEDRGAPVRSTPPTSPSSPGRSVKTVQSVDSNSKNTF